MARACLAGTSVPGIAGTGERPSRRVGAHGVAAAWLGRRIALIDVGACHSVASVPGIAGTTGEGPCRGVGTHSVLAAEPWRSTALINVGARRAVASVPGIAGTTGEGPCRGVGTHGVLAAEPRRSITLIDVSTRRAVAEITCKAFTLERSRHFITACHALPCHIACTIINIKSTFIDIFT